MKTVQRFGKHLIRYTTHETAEVYFIDEETGKPFGVIYDFKTEGYCTIDSCGKVSEEIELNYNLFLAKILMLENVTAISEIEPESAETNGIYEIYNMVSGKYFIGWTNDIHNFKANPFEDLRTGEHWNNHLQNSFNKYGITAFTSKVLSLNLDDVEAEFEATFQHYQNYGRVLYNF